VSDDFARVHYAHSDDKLSCGLIKTLVIGWNLDNIKVVRRVIVSCRATVLLIGMLSCLAGPAFVVIPVGLAILATEYLGRAVARKISSMPRRCLRRKRPQFPSVSPIIEASTRNRSRVAPKTKLTIQTDAARKRGDCSDAIAIGTCDGACEHLVFVKYYWLRLVLPPASDFISPALFS